MTNLPAPAPAAPASRLVRSLHCIGVLCADSSAEAVRKAIIDAGVQAEYARRFAVVFGERLVRRVRHAKRRDESPDAT